jgi:hypothetical protein
MRKRGIQQKYRKAESQKESLPRPCGAPSLMKMPLPQNREAVRVRRIEMRGYNAKSAYADSDHGNVTPQPTQVGFAS